MKTQSILLVSHTVVATVTAIAVAAAGNFHGLLGAVGIGVVAAACVVVTVSWTLSRRLVTAFRRIPAVATKPGQSRPPATGWEEFDASLGELAGHVAKWDDVAANSREQARELQAILTLLDRRQGGGSASGSQLRGVLAGIAQRLQRLLSQIEQNAVDIGRSTQRIADNVDAQGNAVTKASTYVEQLSSGIDAVCREANVIEGQAAENGRTLDEALQMLREITEGMERIRTRSEASERKLRALDDPTRQIRSIVDSIADLAGRTDLLALNAAVESIRAGEHGRGFAIVADEVRKLAEQQSQATREVTVLLEALQMQTQESIARLVAERTDVESESCLGNAAEEVLRRVHRALDEDAARAKRIASAGVQQLQLAREIVLTVDQVSELAKADREHADAARWSMRSLAKTSTEFEDAIDPLRRCRDQRRGDAADATTPEQESIRQSLRDEADGDPNPRPGDPSARDTATGESATGDTRNRRPESHDPHPVSV